MNYLKSLCLQESPILMLIDLYQLTFNIYIHIFCLLKFKIYTLYISLNV